MKIQILTLDKPNANNRIYPFEVFSKALQKARKDLLNENRFLILKKQPESSTVSLLDAVGVITDIQIEGDDVFAEVSFFPNVRGLRETIEQKKMFLRTAGIGTLINQADGNYRVSDDYELISCFLTDDPA